MPSIQPPKLPFAVIRKFFLGDDVISSEMASEALADIEKEMDLIYKMIHAHDQPESKLMSLQEILQLKEGDIVRNVGTGQAWIIGLTNGDSAIGFRMIVVSNPQEWELIQKS